MVPKRERSFATTGVFNAGTNVGAIIDPAAAILLYEAYAGVAPSFYRGRRLFMVDRWWWFYERPEDLTRALSGRFKVIREGEEEPITVSTLCWKLLKYRQLWAFALGKMR